MEYAPGLTRPALGAVASLGQLYDARTDQFLDETIFQNPVPAQFINSTEEFTKIVQIVETDELSGRFECLEVSPELQTSILAGLVDLEGSGRFLDLEEQQNSARAVRGSIIFTVKTGEETLDFKHEEIEGGFQVDDLEEVEATHMVGGVCWGANTIVSCLNNNDKDLDKKEIRERIFTTLKIFAKELTASSEAGVELAEVNDLEITIYGDVLSEGSSDSLSVEQGWQILQKVPDLVKETNGGKGKPLFYKLIPISFLKSHFHPFVTVPIVENNPVDEASLLRVVRYVEKTEKAKQYFNDFHGDVLNHPSCVPPNDLVEIITLKDEVEQDEDRFRSDLGEIVGWIRSGDCDGEEIDKLLEDFEESGFSYKNLERRVKEWKRIQDKIKLDTHLNSYGGKYFGKNKFNERKVKGVDGKHVIFYFVMPNGTEEKQCFQKNKQAFLQELYKKEIQCYYYAVDCDFHPELLPKDKTSFVKVLKNGTTLYEDLLVEMEKVPQAPLAYGVEGLIESFEQPKKRAPLFIPCTGITCNKLVEYDWVCKNCSAQLEWGFDEHVYCTCGKTPVTSLQFKCTDDKHQNFEKHEPAHLQNLLLKLIPFGDLNILIMGETGVGKSTWINAFINFINFESLDNAEAHGELLSLIPAKFTVFNEDFQEVEVCTGDDKNEAMVEGQSSTQGAKVYTFQAGNTTVRLIDTPGIGDTRGVHQDKLNFKNILDTIEHLNELHGICILLKPNNSKVNVMFRFCIKELLTHLHKDASKNIMFCFTNSRSTFYRPGDTYPALRALLKENQDVGIELTRETIYCFDSEAYRFLASVKNDPPVSFPEEEKENFAKSWEKSIVETKRMLAYVRSLRPHPVKSTLNLNHARDMVLKLTRPLAEISRNIQTNKAIVEEEKARIESTEESIKKLKENLMIYRTEIQVVPIPYPKTVCSNSNCVKVWDMAGGGGIKTVEYVQQCHVPCGLEGVAHDTIGDPGLIKCAAMRNGNCVHLTCGHSYREHLHIYYESMQVSRKVEDQAIKEALRMNLSAKDLKSVMIEEKNRQVKKFETELKAIQDASIRFAYFLKKNAITPYNDAMEQYLDHLINEETNKVYQGGNKATLTALNTAKESYLVERKVLEDAMAKGDDNAAVTPSEIKEIVENLKALKYSGESLQDALNCVKRTAQHVHTSTAVHGFRSTSPTYYLGETQQSGYRDKVMNFKRHVCSWLSGRGWNGSATFV